LTISNAGPDTATALSVTDTLPAGVGFVAASGSGWSCDHSGQVVTCTRGSLAASATAPAITIQATAPGVDGTISNSASVSAAEADPVSGNNSDSEDTTVSPVADLSITQADDPDPVSAGANVTYTLSISNAGPSTATNLTVTDTLPPGASFVSASGNNWTGGESSGTVTCTRAQLGTGVTRTIAIVVTAPQGQGSIQNAASVSSETADPDAAGNASSETTTISPLQADLSLSKSDAPDPVDA